MEKFKPASFEEPDSASTEAEQGAERYLSEETIHRAGKIALEMFKKGEIDEDGVLKFFNAVYQPVSETSKAEETASADFFSSQPYLENASAQNVAELSSDPLQNMSAESSGAPQDLAETLNNTIEEDDINDLLGPTVAIEDEPAEEQPEDLIGTEDLEDPTVTEEQPDDLVDPEGPESSSATIEEEPATDEEPETPNQGALPDDLFGKTPRIKTEQGTTNDAEENPAERLSEEDVVNMSKTIDNMSIAAKRFRQLGQGSRSMELAAGQLLSITDKLRDSVNQLLIVYRGNNSNPHAYEKLTEEIQQSLSQGASITERESKNPDIIRKPPQIRQPSLQFLGAMHQSFRTLGTKLNTEKPVKQPTHPQEGSLQYEIF